MDDHSADLLSGLAVEEKNAKEPILPLVPLDTELFRRKLAGLIDPDRKPDTIGEKKSIREDAIRFISILAHLFGETLDRVTLWERIGSALTSSLAKVSDDDLDRFATLCLEHIHAEDSKVAACEPLLQMLSTWESRPREFKQAILHYLHTHRTSALVHGRARWEQVKKGAIEL